MRQLRRANARPTLTRKIHFFRADIGVDGGGQPLPFDAEPALRVIDRLPFTNDGNGRYMLDDEGNALCVWPNINGGNTALRFCQIRRTGLPQLEQAGNVTDLNIAADAGLLEPIHVVFFPGNIVGIEYNHYGPRLSRLGYYLRVKSNNAVPLAMFYPLLRGDVAEQLDRLEEIRLFTLKIRPNYTNVVRQADRSLGDAFAANARVLNDPEEIEVSIKPCKNARHGAIGRLRESLKQLARRNDLRENAGQFQVKGRRDDTHRVEAIDLLKDQLISVRKIFRMGDRSRALDPDSAFEAILAAHDELEDALQQAAAIEV